jgi:DNA end-binding protein Ku
MPRKKAPAKRTGSRPGWSGTISVGLVSFTVEAFNALNREESDIHFHQLHAGCHQRIHYEKVCPKHGPVTNDEIVSGYEVSKGEYVEVDTDELDALRPESDKVLKIDAFITPQTVDPLYFDGRMYYLTPAAKASEEAFDLIVAAMASEGRYGIGQLVMTGKRQLALLRPLGAVLHMAMLNYSKEIRPIDERDQDNPKPSASSSRQLKLARSVIQQWSDNKFDFTQYEDDYREKVQELIDAKIHRKKIVAPKSPKPKAGPLNLMEALKKSLESASRVPKRTRPTRKPHSV